MSRKDLQSDDMDAEQRRTETSTESRRPNAIDGRLFALFAIELLLLAAVCWYYIVNRNSFPHNSSDVASPLWGLLCAVAAGWSTTYFVLAHLAAKKWGPTQSLELFAIAVAGGAVLFGVLLLNIARVFAANSAYVDVRLQYAAKSKTLPTGATARIAGNAKEGRKLYGMSCVACHGPTGDGVANAAPSLRTSEFCKTSDDATIASLIRNGRSATDPASKTNKIMPAKGGNPFLNESKIADLVAYLKELADQFPAGGAVTEVAVNPVLVGSESSAAVDTPSAPLAVVHEWTLDDLAGLNVTATEELIGIGSQAFVKATCSKCHIAAVAGKELGPTLDQIAKKYRRDELLQHMVDPSLEINERFQDHTFFLMDGRTVTGVIAAQTEEQIDVITNLLDPETLTAIPIDDIDEQAKSKVSPMPGGLLNVLTVQEIAGLVAYVDAVGSQMAAASPEPLSRSAVPAPTSVPAPTTSQSLSQTLSDSNSSRKRLEYGLSFSWLFVIVTSVSALHCIWAVGAGTAVLLHQELQLRSGARLLFVQQTVLFWIIGEVWLALWLVMFVSII